MAIDEIAEDVVAACLERAGDIGYYSEDRGYVAFGRPARSSSSIRSTARGPRRPDSSRVACRSVSSRRASTPPSATCGSASCTRSSPVTSSTRRVAKARSAGGPTARRSRCALRRTRDLRALFWTAGLRGRPVLPVSIVLEQLIDRSSMRGGYFDLGSATFNMTRIVTGQLDAYVDVGRRLVDEIPELEAQFREVGEGAVCTNFPYDVAASSLIVEEAGGVVTRGRRSAARRPSGGRVRRRLRTRGPRERFRRVARAAARRSRRRDATTHPHDPPLTTTNWNI